MPSVQVKNATGKVNIPELSNYSVTITDQIFGPANEVKLSSGGSTWIKLTKTNKTEVLTPKEGLQAAIFIIESNGTVVSGTDKFFLEFISEQVSEKISVSETFAENDPSIYIFGKKNLPITFSGSVYNADHLVKGSLHGQWEKGLKEWWKTSLRAGALIKNGESLGPQIAMLVADNEIFYGYPIKLSFSKNANEPLMSKFSMTWVLTGKSFIVNTKELGEFMEFGDSNKIQEIHKQEGIIRRDTTIIRDILNVINRGLSYGRCYLSDFKDLQYLDKEGEKVPVLDYSFTDKNMKTVYKWAPRFVEDIILKLEKESLESLAYLKPFVPEKDKESVPTLLRMSSESLRSLETKGVLNIFARKASDSVPGTITTSLPASELNNAFATYTKATAGLVRILNLADDWQKEMKAQLGVYN